MIVKYGVILLILICSGCTNIELENPEKPMKSLNTVEYNKISRSALLEILLAYEEQIRDKIAGKKLKPIFTARFDNNIHTRPFIYPDMKKRSQLRLQPDPSFWTKTSWIQLGYGLWVNLTVLGIGLHFGFPAVTLPQLKKPDSEIKITVREEAWIASVLTLTSPIGSLFSGLLMDRYGRKLVLVLCEIPLCFGWFYAGLARDARDIIIGRAVGGIGLGMAMSAPRAYITEITLPNMRGVVGALPNLAISIGIALQAGLGSLLKWYTLCYLCGIYSFVILISTTCLPDTPYFLLMKSTPSAARMSLKKFRSSRFNVDAELTDLCEFKNENDIRSLSFTDQFKAMWKPSACKPFGISSLFICLTQVAGVSVVVMYAVEILESANASFDAHLGNFMMALTRITFGILTSILLYKVRRRVMTMISGVGVGVFCIGFCIFLYTNDNKSSPYPQFILMAYVAFASLGLYTLPLIIMFELLPLQLRGLLSGICISELHLFMFAMNNCYPFLRIHFGLANTMALFGAMSLLGTFILYFILPETKDLTLQEIEEYFNDRRATLVSQRRVITAQLGDSSKSGKFKSSSSVKSIIIDKKKKVDQKNKDGRNNVVIKDNKDD